MFIIIINTVSVMFDNYDWCMMVKLLGVSSYRRRIKADKDKDVFIGPKEFVSHMMMTQTKYRLYHQLK